MNRNWGDYEYEEMGFSDQEDEDVPFDEPFPIPAHTSVETDAPEMSLDDDPADTPAEDVVNEVENFTDSPDQQAVMLNIAESGDPIVHTDAGLEYCVHNTIHGKLLDHFGMANVMAQDRDTYLRMSEISDMLTTSLPAEDVAELEPLPNARAHEDASVLPGLLAHSVVALHSWNAYRKASADPEVPSPFVYLHTVMFGNGSSRYRCSFPRVPFVSLRPVVFADIQDEYRATLADAKNRSLFRRFVEPIETDWGFFVEEMCALSQTGPPHCHYAAILEYNLRVGILSPKKLAVSEVQGFSPGVVCGAGLLDHVNHRVVAVFHAAIVKLGVEDPGNFRGVPYVATQLRLLRMRTYAETLIPVISNLIKKAEDAKETRNASIGASMIKQLYASITIIEGVTDTMLRGVLLSDPRGRGNETGALSKSIVNLLVDVGTALAKKVGYTDLWAIHLAALGMKSLTFPSMATYLGRTSASNRLYEMRTGMRLLGTRWASSNRMDGGLLPSKTPWLDIFMGNIFHAIAELVGNVAKTPDCNRQLLGQPSTAAMVQLATTVPTGTLVTGGPQKGIETRLDALKQFTINGSRLFAGNNNAYLERGKHAKISVPNHVEQSLFHCILGLESPSKYTMRRIIGQFNRNMASMEESRFSVVDMNNKMIQNLQAFNEVFGSVDNGRYSTYLYHSSDILAMVGGVGHTHDNPIRTTDARLRTQYMDPNEGQFSTPRAPHPSYFFGDDSVYVRSALKIFARVTAKERRIMVDIIKDVKDYYCGVYETILNFLDRYRRWCEDIEYETSGCPEWMTWVACMSSLGVVKPYKKSYRGDGSVYYKRVVYQVHSLGVDNICPPSHPNLYLFRGRGDKGY